MDFDQLFISLYCMFVIFRYINGDECIKVDPCSCKTSKVTVDLHKLTKTIDIVNNTYKYQFQPCVGLKDKCGTSTETVAVCQRASVGDNSYDLGDLTTASFSGDPESGTNPLKLTYTANQRSSIFTFICDRKEDGKLTSASENPPKTYNFKFNTKYSCFGSAGGGSSSKGISTGSVLLIIFFLFLGIYFIAGMLFLKFARGAQGTEMIPNYDFWTSLPGYIKDGIVFTSRGCKTESSYSQI